MNRFLFSLTAMFALASCAPDVTEGRKSCLSCALDDTGEDDDTGVGVFGDEDDDTGTDDDTDPDSSGSEDLDGDGRTGAIDCDDTNDQIYPGATEVCNGLDDNCDGQTDEGDVCSTVDNDGDGYSPAGGDCDDSDADIYPGADDEPGDGIDSDCDDEMDPEDDVEDDDDADTGTEDDDDDVSGTDETDDDGDGYSEDAGDCDDADADIHPSAEEREFDSDGNVVTTIDGIDNDCDGEIDEDWQAMVTVTHLNSGSYDLGVGQYDSGDEMEYYGWQETSSTSTTTVSVELLTADYDLSGSCGLRMNGVSSGEPYLCYEWSIDESVDFDIWFLGTWYDQSNVTEWIYDADTGECSAVFQMDSDSSCIPVNDE